MIIRCKQQLNDISSFEQCIQIYEYENMPTLFYNYGIILKILKMTKNVIQKSMPKHTFLYHRHSIIEYHVFL